MKKILGLIEACELIQNHQLSPQDYLEDCSSKADLQEPQLKAFFTRASLAELHLQVKPGALMGIPIGVKDIIATTDFITTNGSPIYKDHRPHEDAGIIKKIRDEGGVVFGKTVTTEFAYRTPGPTTNPWNAQHTPGGSSSGSAAAVATGIVPLALGSQTQGSILRPAAYCGVVGFKASFGAVPRAGVHPLSGSLDHIGFFTRCVDDAAYALQLLKNNDFAEDDAIVLPAIQVGPNARLKPFLKPRIALLTTGFDHLMSDEQTQALASAANTLRSAGATVANLTLPSLYWEALQAMNLILECEAAAIHADHLKNNPDLLSMPIQDIAQKGARHAAGDYIRAKNLQKYLRQSIGAYFAQYDVFLTVPATGEAPKGLTSTGDSIFCALWSFLGTPAISLPMTLSSKQLPLGIQCVGNYTEDEKLLRIAKFIEQIIGPAPSLA